MANEFLRSVADAVIRDATTGAGIAYGKTNISSAFNVSMQKTEVRGGRGNDLLYTFYHDRLVEINIEEAIFNKNTLAMNVGATVANGAVNVLKTDCLVTSSSGSATLSETPVSTTVAVFLSDGTIQDVTPTGTTITVSGANSARVDAIYTYSETVDQITIDGSTPPDTVELNLLADVYNAAGTNTYQLQIYVPKFQISGNYTMNFAANGVATSTLQGNALLSEATDCSGGDYYAKARWVPVGATAVAVSSIAATPTTLEFDDDALPGSQNISVLGIRGGLYTNTDITTSCSFAMSGTSCSYITAGLHTGLITVAASASGSQVGTCNITYYDATNGNLTDTVDISVVE
jgi:hypothetical protein